MTIAGLWRYGDWQHVATGCTALVWLTITKPFQHVAIAWRGYVHASATGRGTSMFHSTPPPKMPYRQQPAARKLSQHYLPESLLS